MPYGNLLCRRYALAHRVDIGTAFQWTRRAGLSQKQKPNFSHSATLEAVSFRIHCYFMIDSFQFLVPVIVIFTKFDALYDIEYAKLKCEGVSRKDANELAPKHVRESFATGPQVKLLYDPDGNRRPPKCHVCLPGKLIKHQIAIERLIICIQHVAWIRMVQIAALSWNGQLKLWTIQCSRSYSSRLNRPT
jgi:hypothetical protein